MATEKQQVTKAFCVKDELVLMQEREIVSKIIVDEEDLKEAIVRQIKVNKERRPAQIFRKAVTELTSIDFKHLSYKYEGESIQDSQYYRKFLDFIKEVLNIKGIIKRQEIEKQAKKEFRQKNAGIIMYERDEIKKAYDRRAKKKRG